MLRNSNYYHNFALVKGNILCPHCGKVLGRYEDVRGEGDLYLFCKRCKRERYISIRRMSLDR